MKRTRKTNRKADAILTADWHIRETVPICRTDDFMAAQWFKVQYINKLARRHGCSVLHAGDLFDHWKPSPALLSETIENLQCKFVTVYGNHDLPQHNLDLAYKCGLYVLEQADCLVALPQGHWGQEPGTIEYRFHHQGKKGRERKVVLVHVMTWVGKSPWPGCTDPSAEELLDQFPDADLVVTGHNHQSFTYRSDDGRLLVNPGSITRQDADQIDHQPSVYLWFAEDNTVERHVLPHADGVISREHLESEKKSTSRYQAFIQRLQSGEGASVASFRENLERFFKEEKVTKPVRNLIMEKLEDENG